MCAFEIVLAIYVQDIKTCLDGRATHIGRRHFLQTVIQSLRFHMQYHEGGLR